MPVFIVLLDCMITSPRVGLACRAIDALRCRGGASLETGNIPMTYRFEKDCEPERARVALHSAEDGSAAMKRTVADEEMSRLPPAARCGAKRLPTGATNETAPRLRGHDPKTCARYDEINPRSGEIPTSPTRASRRTECEKLMLHIGELRAAWLAQRPSDGRLQLAWLPSLR